MTDNNYNQKKPREKQKSITKANSKYQERDKHVCACSIPKGRDERFEGGGVGWVGREGGSKAERTRRNILNLSQVYIVIV